VVPTVALAQAIGRWGNFFNSEAHGGSTDLPWAILVDGEKVHPTFLYESIWCFLLFFVLLFIDNRRKFEGQTFLLYGILYSLERFIVEGLRTDSLMLFGFIRQAQFLSLLVVVFGIIAYVYLNKRSGQRGFLAESYKLRK
jgi:phosphatidylglycerol:prolipoprotein diacylglycerol transferase